MLLPFSLDTERTPESGEPTSEIAPTRRTDEPYLLSLTASARAKAEGADSADGEYLRAVFAASPMPIVALDRLGVVTLWNPAAAALFGFSAEEAVGRSAPPDFVALAARALGGVTSTGLELKQLTKAGPDVEVRVSIAPLRNARDDIYGVVAIFTV